MKKMLLFLVTIMVAMISCDKDEIIKPREDPNNPANVSIKFNIDVSMVETVMPIHHMIVGMYTIVQIEIPEADVDHQCQGFKVNVWKINRTVTGDTAKLWLGKIMHIITRLEVYDNQTDRIEDWSIATPVGVDTIVQKQNTYAFIFSVPASYYPKK